MFHNVLVIDDDPVFCEMLQSYLEQVGIKGILIARDGRDALRVLQQKSDQIDFIALDLNLPDLDGIELLSKIKELSFSGPIAIVSSETPVIIDMAETSAQQFGLNVVDAIKKPLTNEAVDRWLARETAVEHGNRERRSAPRRNANIDGVIKSSEMSVPLPCTILNISEIGAKLHAESGNHIPDAFQLCVEQQGIWRRAYALSNLHRMPGGSFKSRIRAKKNVFSTF